MTRKSTKVYALVLFCRPESWHETGFACKSEF
jgi:hypothetical protein